MSEQRSPEWFAQRLGKISASRIADMMARTKSGEYGAGRETYKTELAFERLYGEPTPEKYKSAAMVAGTEAEPEAKSAYEFMYGVDIEECGFIPHPTIGMSGASPDGLVGTDGLVEIKCPELTAHKKTLLGAKPKREYMLQMQWQLACTGRKWVDFISYLSRKECPSDKADNRGMRLHVLRVWRDPKVVAEIEAAVIVFLREIEDEYRKLDRQYPDQRGEPDDVDDQSVLLQGG